MFFSLYILAGYPLMGNHQCAISKKYRKMNLIIIIISLVQILLSYIAITSRTHACSHAHMRATRTLSRTRTHTHTHTHTTVAVQVVAVTVRWVGAPNHDEVNAPFSPVPLAMNDWSELHSNKQSRMRRGIRDSFGCFSHIQTILRRIETELMTGCVVSRYKQYETSRETIE